MNPDSSPMVHGAKEGGTDGFTGNHTPQKITITLPSATYKDLERRSAAEGRRMSNLAALILENALVKE